MLFLEKKKNAVLRFIRKYLLPFFWSSQFCSLKSYSVITADLQSSRATIHQHFHTLQPFSPAKRKNTHLTGIQNRLLASLYPKEMDMRCAQ